MKIEADDEQYRPCPNPDTRPGVAKFFFCRLKYKLIRNPTKCQPTINTLQFNIYNQFGMPKAIHHGYTCSVCQSKDEPNTH